MNATRRWRDCGDKERGREKTPRLLQRQKINSARKGGGFALRSDRRCVFLDRRRNRRDDKLKTFREKSRRIRRILEFGSELRRRAVLAIPGRDHGRSAFVMRANLVQLFV
jgi:hypothetical protein